MRGISLLMAALCIAVLFGCSRRASEPSGDPELSEAQVRLRTVSPFGGLDPSGADYQELTAKFSAEHPEVRVSDESAMSDEAWKAKVIGDFAAGNEPDVLFFFTGSDAKELIRRGKVVPIDTIMVQYPDYGANIKKEALEYMREWDDRIYALPVRGIWEGLFCNEDLFIEYGVKLPTDWELFTEAINAFSKTDIVPLAASLSDIPHYLIENLVLSAGGAREHDFVPRAGIGISQYPKSWIRGINLFKDLNDMGAFAPNVLSTRNDMAQELFTTKNAAMMVNGSWFVGAVKDQNHTVVMPMPPMPESEMKQGEIISGFSMGFYITQRAWESQEKRSAAVRFVEFMTSNESIEVFSRVAGNPAADIPDKGSPTRLEYTGILLWKTAPDTCMPIDSRLSKRAWDRLYSLVPDVAQGKVNAESVLNEVAQKNT